MHQLKGFKVERTEFKKKKFVILKVFAIFTAVIASIAIVIGFVYSRFGLLGFAGGAIDTDKQVLLSPNEIIDEELNYIINALGYNPLEKKEYTIYESKRIELELSSAGVQTIMIGLLKEEDTFNNLMVTTNNDTLSLSLIGNTDLILQLFDVSREMIESTIGKVPDEIPLYLDLKPGEGVEASVLEKLKIGSIKIPNTILKSINPYVDEGLHLLFLNSYGIELEKLTVKENKVNLVGNFPIKK